MRNGGVMALIYVVEDDKNISEIESFALKNAGHQIVECASGKEFHKQVIERIPDLILLDIMLPDEDGLQILTKMRATPETRRVPVILVTAKTTEIDKVKGLDMGADDYLTKPFGVMELISRVKALLRRVRNHKSGRCRGKYRRIAGAERYPSACPSRFVQNRCSRSGSRLCSWQDLRVAGG